KLVAFGYARDYNSANFAIARLNPNGVPDTGFGDTGRVITPINSIDGATDGAVQSDSKILAFGATPSYDTHEIVIARFLAHPASPTFPNPIDCPDFFVRQQYLDFLGREPDPLAAQWVSMITGCAVDDPSCDRIHVSEAFFKSPEFQDRGY